MAKNITVIPARKEYDRGFGNPLEQYRSVQFADITENTEPISNFDSDFGQYHRF